MNGHKKGGVRRRTIAESIGEKEYLALGYSRREVARNLFCTSAFVSNSPLTRAR